MSALATQALAQETSFDKLANLPFSEGRPTKETAQTLRNELLSQRATQVYVWAMPLINRRLGVSWPVSRFSRRFRLGPRTDLDLSQDFERPAP